MSLNMAGVVDGVFGKIPVEVRTEVGGGYVDGIWVPGSFEVTTFPRVDAQPLNLNELDFFIRAEQRIIDVRKLYFNDSKPKLKVLELNEDVWFLDQRWKVIRRDYRPWHNYVKLIVDRFDDQ